jgi:hypothetical protein
MLMIPGYGIWFETIIYVCLLNFILMFYFKFNSFFSIKCEWMPISCHIKYRELKKNCWLKVTVIYLNLLFCFAFSAIKMSSPMVNNVIIVGCLLIYLEILVNAIAYDRNEDGVTGSRLCMVIVFSFHLKILRTGGVSPLYNQLFERLQFVYFLWNRRSHDLFIYSGMTLTLRVRLL